MNYQVESVTRGHDDLQITCCSSKYNQEQKKIAWCIFKSLAQMQQSQDCEPSRPTSTHFIKWMFTYDIFRKRWFLLFSEITARTNLIINNYLRKQLKACKSWPTPGSLRQASDVHNQLWLLHVDCGGPVLWHRVNPLVAVDRHGAKNLEPIKCFYKA